MPKFTFKKRYSGKDVAQAFKLLDKQLAEEMKGVGEEAVEYAKENGDYRDVSGHLRASNRYEVKGHALRLYNSADYAADMEARGHDVIGGAALFAEQRLKEICEG